MSSDWFLVATHPPPFVTSRTADSIASPSAGNSTAAEMPPMPGYHLEAVVTNCASARQTHARAAFRRISSAAAMTPEDVQRSQKPYRYGMILLCFGALINWVGLAENYTETVRYAGIACIVCGALLICTAMCCWLHTPNRSAASGGDAEDGGINGTGAGGVQVISAGEHLRAEKPPEYDTCIVHPPSYDDALQLSPAALLAEAQKLEKLRGSALDASDGPPQATTISIAS